MSEQTTMNLFDFCRKIVAMEDHIKRATSAQDSGNYARSDSAMQNAEITFNELKEMWANCPTSTREKSFQDLNVSMGDIDTILKDWLFSEPLEVVEAETEE